MNSLRLVIASVLLVASAFGQLQKETSFVARDVGRVLQYEGVVNADVNSVWKGLTTPDGLKGMIAPVAYLELKMGGKWLTNMNPSAKIGDPGTIQNQILSFVPNRMLSMKPDLPKELFALEVRNADSLFAVITLTAVSSKQTHVRISMVGFGTGPSWDMTYRIFRQCTQDTLTAIQQRFRKGPIDWARDNPYIKHNHPPIKASLKSP